MGTYSPGSRGMALSYGRMGPTTLDSLLTTLNQGRALCSTLMGTYSPGSGRTRPSQAKGPTCSARVETTREAFLLGFLKDWKHKLKRLVQHPNSYFMDVKCPGCYRITTVF